MKPSSWYNNHIIMLESLRKNLQNTGRKYCLLTLIAHLHTLIPHSLRLKESDEIIVPGQLVSVSPVFQTKAKIKFCDIEESTCISLEKLKKL